MIVLAAEAGPAIGAGHAMRCLAVAEALRALGAEAAFALAPEALAVVPRLAGAGFPVLEAGPHACAAVLMDGYGFAAEDERAWAAAGAKVAVFEDAPGRPHACALLVDPAPGRVAADYAAFAPGARSLLGPDYAPLGAAFARVRAEALARRERPGPVHRALVSTGLTDAARLAPAAVEILRSDPAVEVIDVAVGASAPTLPALERQAAEDPRVRLHLDAGDMAALTAAADIAVGAAGTSAWERCALGLPSVVVTAAENQGHNARMLAAAGAALVVGVEQIASALAALANGETRRRMSRAAAALVDARGAERVARALLEF